MKQYDDKLLGFAGSAPTYALQRGELSRSDLRFGGCRLVLNSVKPNMYVVKVLGFAGLAPTYGLGIENGAS